MSFIFLGLVGLAMVYDPYSDCKGLRRQANCQELATPNVSSQLTPIGESKSHGRAQSQRVETFPVSLVGDC